MCPPGKAIIARIYTYVKAFARLEVKFHTEGKQQWVTKMATHKIGMALIDLAECGAKMDSDPPKIASEKVHGYIDAKAFATLLEIKQRGLCPSTTS